MQLDSSESGKFFFLFGPLNSPGVFLGSGGESSCLETCISTRNISQDHSLLLPKLITENAANSTAMHDAFDNAAIQTGPVSSHRTVPHMTGVLWVFRAVRWILSVFVAISTDSSCTQDWIDLA
ncbi:hypothetical protein AcV5_005402 [Taiwanofungus camphoratus]|nr:hypothetical protein AcV5_005402 [Antrodia cinnamomea]KAI0929570.1 hypothetical protein AcV7_005063 [Antrodia cinnamomea]